MPRLDHERILLIGDTQRHVHTALSHALPGAYVMSVATYFDGIAELTANQYTTVLASAEPIERRPEAAIKTIRSLAGDSRLLLIAEPAHESLSRKMLDFGCDDYLISPVSAGELQQIFGTPPLRISGGEGGNHGAPAEPLMSSPSAGNSALLALPLADILLEALLQHPHEAPAAAVKQINAQLPATMRVLYLASDAALPPVPDEVAVLSHAVRANNEDTAMMHLLLPGDEDHNAHRHFLAQLAYLVGKVAGLQDRHNRLQRLAITDDITGLHNSRYFRHFLTKVVEKARALRFPVTLLLFDIDNFKSYNDQYGHGVGDDILRQTAALMKRCVRDHDLVARIGGDEFAVVFWEKEGPRQPREGKPGLPGRPPQTPEQILERFQQLLKTQEFKGLGPTGKGQLSISGGLAVYPYDARDVNELIDEADRRLMFGAKRSGKNSIYLVGSDSSQLPPDEAKP